MFHGNSTVFQSLGLGFEHTLSAEAQNSLTQRNFEIGCLIDEAILLSLYEECFFNTAYIQLTNYIFIPKMEGKSPFQLWICAPLVENLNFEDLKIFQRYKNVKSSTYWAYRVART